MSKAFKEILQNVKEDIKESVSLSNILHDIGTEMKQQVGHGAHECAAALFNGSAFVMYQRTGKNSVDGPQQGMSIEPMTQPEQEQSRGGMEM